MKKYISIILMLILSISLFGCNSQKDNTVNLTISFLEHDETDDCISGNGSVTYVDNKENFHNILSTDNYSVEKGTNAMDALEKVLSDEKIEYEADETNSYFISIDNLSWMDHGPNSGWMYLINGKAATDFINAYTLEEDMEIIFYYSDDYAKEESM